MSRNKNHIDKELFRRYLSDEMTDAERNAFEKELQKNSLEAEAMDGFENVSSAKFENDLNELSQKISSKKPKSRMPYFAAAATILLLITSGIIWMQLNRQQPIQKVSEVTIDKAEKEAVKPVERESAKTEVTDDTTIKQAGEKQSEIKTRAEQAPVKEKKTEGEEKIITIEEQFAVDETEIISKIIPGQAEEQTLAKDTPVKITSNKSIKLAQTKPTPFQRLNTAPAKENVIRGQILSDTDGLPLPGVTVIEKGTDNGTITDINGNFKMKLENDSNPVIASFIGMEPTKFQPKKDSDNIITLTTDDVALSEVVVVGYGSKQKNSVTGSTMVVPDESIASDAEPICGMSKYKAYLKEKAILPADYETDKVVVRLRFTIANSGEIQSFQNLNDADESFYEQAKIIVFNGPAWKPVNNNNSNIYSTVNLRVVFKKTDD